MLHVGGFRDVGDGRNVGDHEPHEHEHVWNEHVGARGPGPEDGHAVPNDPEEEEARAIHPGPGLRTGETLQTAEILIGPGEGALSQHDQPHPDPGQDLVPEPPLQEQARPEGQGKAGPAIGQPAFPQKSRRARVGERREALYRLEQRRRGPLGFQCPRGEPRRRGDNGRGLPSLERRPWSSRLTDPANDWFPDWVPIGGHQSLPVGPHQSPV